MQKIIDGVYLDERDDYLVLINRVIEINIDRMDGFIRSIKTDHAIVSIPSLCMVDVKIGETWLTKARGLHLEKFMPFTQDNPVCAGLCITYQAGSDLKLVVNYEVTPESSFFIFSVCLQFDTVSSQPLRLESYHFEIGPFVLDKSFDCEVDVPGPFPTYGLGEPFYLAPKTKLTELAGVDTPVGSAPDWGPGILALSNPVMGLSLGTWMDTRGEVNYLPILQSDGQQITFSFEDLKSTWLKPGENAYSDRLYVAVADDIPGLLAGYRCMAEESMPLAPERPEWVEDMIILEAMPQAYGGINGLRERLSDYVAIGVNTLYIMPHWLGAYSNLDPFMIDPTLGTVSDLRSLVDTAHSEGMRVLFDMVIHGFDPESSVIQQKPGMFFHNEDGTLANHPLWGTISTDWVSPDYQQYMVDLVRHQIQEYGIDGYRLDAASFKGANWDPHLPYPAYRSGCGALALIGEMIKAGRELKSEFIILNEVFGPAFYMACDLTHDNMTMGPQIILERMEKGLAQIGEYKQHISDIYSAIPAGACRVFFARNHDTSWFYHFNGYTPSFFNLDAIHAFFGIPEIFGGDPKYGPNPDETPGFFGFYKKVWQVRRSMPALSRGEIMLLQVTCDCPQVFSGARLLEESGALVLISFSDQYQQAAVTINLPSTWQVVGIKDVLTGTEVPFRPITQGISLSLKPFQVVVGRLAR